MVCYIVPLAAAAIGAMIRKKTGSRGGHGFWLNIMLFGGSIFGVVDHFWNGELLAIGANWTADLALGGAITASIFAGWGAIVIKPRVIQAMSRLNCMLGIIDRQEKT